MNKKIIEINTVSHNTNNTKSSDIINLSDFEYMAQFDFVYNRVESKIPTQSGWPDLRIDHKEISKWVDFPKAMNYGILTGVNGLIVIDCDIPKETKGDKLPHLEKKDILINLIKEKFPETLEVTTGSGGKHFYYLCDEFTEKLQMNIYDSKLNNILHCGEIQTKGQYVVGPGSLHPNGNYYKITERKPIATITKTQITEVLKEYFKKHTITKTTPKKAGRPKTIQRQGEIQDYNISNDVPIHKIFGIENTEAIIDHPIHGSTNGGNFKIDTKTNKFTCFRCNVSGGSLMAIALKEGMLECSEGADISKAQYSKARKLAVKKYGMEFKDSGDLKFFRENYKIYFIEQSASTIYGILKLDTKTVMLKNGLSNLAEHLRNILINSVSFETANSYIQYENEAGKMVNKTNEGFVRGLFKINSVYNEGFKPTLEVTFDDENNTYLNTYKPTKYLLGKTKTENINFEQECPDIDYVISNLTGHEEKSKKYLLDLLAFMLQKPHIRTGKVVSFYGGEGSGKGIFYEQILAPIFGNNQCAFLNQAALEGQYNGVMAGKLVVWFNEITHKAAYEEKVKTLSTAKTTEFNVKYGSNYQGEIYFTIFADCNGENPLWAGARRSVMFKSEPLGGTRNASDKLGPKLAAAIPGQLNKFSQFLWDRKVSFDRDINNVYDSREKMDILKRNMTHEESFVESMSLYSTWEDFVIGNVKSEKYGTPLTLEETRTKYLKSDYIWINAFLDSYNGYRKNQNKNYTTTTMKSFAWIYSKLKIDRSRKKEFKGVKIKGFHRYYISVALVEKYFKQFEIESEVNIIKDADLSEAMTPSASSIIEDVEQFDIL